MFTYQILLKEDGQWQKLKHTISPICDTTTLDESLDSGFTAVSMSSRSEDIKPFTPIKVVITDDSDNSTREIVRLVADVTRIRRVYSPREETRWDYKINTIEYTKLLEREVCDTMTFTNFLGKSYEYECVDIPISEKDIHADEGKTYPYYFPNNTDISYMDNAKALKSPYMVGKALIIPNIDWTYSLTFGTPGRPDRKIFIVLPDGTEEYIGYHIGRYDYVDYTYKLSQTGKYKLIYRGVTVNGPGDKNNPCVDKGFYVSLSFLVTKDIQPKTFLSIKDCINRFLSAGVTRQPTDPQKYVLNFLQTEKLKEIMAPEFFITRSTLFEGLSQIGGYINAIPRLEYPTDANYQEYGADIKGVVYFDMLGGDEELNITVPLSYCEDSYSMDSYCSALDAPVDNLLNSRDLAQGSIIEPGVFDQYKTVRTETGVMIDADNMIIQTDFPIYNLIKLECGFQPQTNKLVGDITPFVFENAEYACLSEYKGAAYPYSKAYALVYTQGEHNISALNFHLKGSTDLDTSFQKFSITNIMESKTGVAITEKGYPFNNIAFRVTYIPIVSARVVQKRADSAQEIDNTLFYNQGANTVESEMFGENLKGTIARMGQNIEVRTYYFRKLSELPKCGQLLDGKYVGIMSCEYERYRIKATITLTPNFNKLAEYISINSNKRFYDVSEKQSVDRHVNYGQTVIIGKSAQNSAEVCLFRESGQIAIMSTFGQRLLDDTVGDSDFKITSVLAQTVQKNGTVNATMSFPCLATGMGNSILLTWRFTDNFGAGYQARFLSDTRNVQHLMSYADVYGEFYNLDLKYVCRKFDGTHAMSSWQASRQTNTAKQDGEAGLMPAANQSLCDYSNHNALIVGDYIIEKDGRENIIVSTQIHFIANDQSVVVGSALAQNSLLVTDANADKAAKLYFLSRKVNMLNSFIDLSGGVEGEFNISMETNRGKININAIPSTAIGNIKSWVLIDKSKNKLYLGYNFKKPKIAKESVDSIYFNF